MASKHMPLVPLGDEPGNAAPQHTPWRKLRGLSSIADGAEGFLASSGFDRGPWMAVALAAGIAAWFVLNGPAGWVTAMAAGLLVALGAVAAWKGREDRTHLIGALVASGLLLAFGTGLAWSRSEVVGAEALERPVYDTFEGRILERIE